MVAGDPRHYASVEGKQLGVDAESVDTERMNNDSYVFISTDDDVNDLISSVGDNTTYIFDKGAHSYPLDANDECIPLPTGSSNIEFVIPAGATVQVADSEIDGTTDQGGLFIITNNCDNITIRGYGTISGNESNNTNPNTISDFVLARIKDRATDISVENVKLSDSGGQAIRIQGAGDTDPDRAVGISLQNLRIDNVAEGIFGERCKRVRVIKPTITNVDQQDGIEPARSSENWLIKDPTIDTVGSGNSGIDIFSDGSGSGIIDVTVEGGIIRNCPSGITVEDTTGSYSITDLDLRNVDISNASVSEVQVFSSSWDGGSFIGLESDKSVNVILSGAKNIICKDNDVKFQSFPETSLVDDNGVGTVRSDTGRVFDTIQEAVYDANAKVSIGAGTYNENVLIQTQGLTIVGDGRETIIDGGTSNAAIRIKAADVTIRDLSVQTTAGAGNNNHGITNDGATIEDVLIERVWVRDSDARGIIMNSSSESTVRECVVESTDQGGIQGHSIRVIDCTTESGVGGTAIDLVSTDATARGNRVKSPAGNGIRALGDDAIVAENRITNAGGDGVSLEGTDQICTSNRISGSGLSDIDQASATTPTVGNNNTGA